MGENAQLDLLRLVGEALHGERWQSPLASGLGVSDRAVRYWLSAATPCPDDLGGRLLTVVVRRREEINAVETIVVERLRRTAGIAS